MRRDVPRHLIDGDIASNQHNWQWVAGCGTDAAPFFRIFNPSTQAKKFDPDGAYARKYAPDSHTLEPIVDHALDRYQAVKP